MAANNEWLTLRQTAKIMGIPQEELIDGLFETWAPPHYFEKGSTLRFRFVDVWLWLIANGWTQRARRVKLLYSR
jgi:hypothetical protein